MSPAVMNPRSHALAVASSCRPMLVGEVRIATTGAGSSWKLSGASQCVSSPHEAVEEAPVQQRVAQRLGPRSARERTPAGDGGRAERVRDRRRGRPEQDQRGHRDRELPERRGRVAARRPARPPGARRPAATATAGHMSRQTPPADAGTPRSVPDAVCHSSRCRRLTTSRQSVRTIASAETQAWCGRKTTASADLLHARRRVAPHRRVVGPPGLVERRPEHREQEGDDPGRGDGAQAQQGPAHRRAGEHRPPRQQEERAGRSPPCCAAGCRGSSSATAATAGCAPGRPAPARGGVSQSQELPVAADPAVLAPRVGQVAGGIVVVDDDVGGQPGAGVAPLDQVVREQRVLREAAVRGLLEGVDVVDPLPGEAPLAVEVLVDVGDRGGVRVHARVAGVDGGEARAVRAGQRDTHPRLEDAVAAHHAPARRVVDRAVERVGQRADQQRRRVGREHGVGVERDHVAHAARAARRRPPRSRRRPAAPPRRKRLNSASLPALPLPPHPDALLRVPAPRPVEEVEGVLRVRRVARVERAHALHGGRDDGRVVLRASRRARR